MMPERRDGIVRGRGTMQIGHRAEGGFPDRSGVERSGNSGAHGLFVHDGGLRHNIMRMLPVREDAAPVGLGDLEQLRVSARSQRPRFGARHPAESERPTRGGTLRHRHQPVDAAELVIRPSAELPVVLQKDVSVDHHRPAARGRVIPRQRRGVGKPRGARSHTRRRDSQRPLLAFMLVLGVPGHGRRAGERGDDDRDRRGVSVPGLQSPERSWWTCRRGTAG